MVNAQAWLKRQQEYNTKEKREKVTELDISSKSLKGKLDLNDFINLKKLDCYSNELTNIDLTNCKKLEVISCSRNKITNLSLPNYCSNLVVLDCKNNRLTNLSFLSEFNPEKLINLDINNNNFKGRLNLSDFANLKELCCSHNNLTFLNLANCSQLEKIDCRNNPLTNITLPNDPTNLKELYHGNLEQLKQEFSNWWQEQQAQIKQSPKLTTKKTWNDGDEIYNNSNLHSEDQNELEIPDKFEDFNTQIQILPKGNN